MKKQLAVLIVAGAWVSLVVLDQKGLFATIALSLPAVLLAAILYYWFAGYIPNRKHLLLFLGTAVWLSGGFAKGYRDCCKDPDYIPVLHVTPDGEVIRSEDTQLSLKPAHEVQSEVIAYSIPCLLFGSIAYWWLRSHSGRAMRRGEGNNVIDAEYLDVQEGGERSRPRGRLLPRGIKKL